MNCSPVSSLVFTTRNSGIPALWVGLVICLSLCPWPPLCFGQDRSTARSMVITRQGIVATSHTLASQAGAQILARGGSAVDAAIAANTVLAVTEPMMCGIGGDLFVLYWEAKTGKLTGLNASGWAPKGLTPAYLSSKGIQAMPRAQPPGSRPGGGGAALARTVTVSFSAGYRAK